MRLLFCLVVLHINIGCITKHIVSKSEKAVQLKIHWQLVGGQNGKGEVMEIIDSIFVIKRKDYLIYLIPQVTEHYKKTVNQENEIIGDSLLSETTNFQFLFFRRVILRV